MCHCCLVLHPCSFIRLFALRAILLMAMLGASRYWDAVRDTDADFGGIFLVSEALPVNTLWLQFSCLVGIAVWQTECTLHLSISNWKKKRKRVLILCSLYCIYAYPLQWIFFWLWICSQHQLNAYICVALLYLKAHDESGLAKLYSTCTQLLV